ncbi:MAG TPA: NAD/NADP octopine/nopaline dehydrogenase family protein [Chroococcales cyanobacterium]
MLLTVQAQTNQLLSLQEEIASPVKSADLCIIGDGAQALAAGCMLAGENQSLRVLLPKSDKPAGKNSAAPASKANMPVRFEMHSRAMNQGPKLGKINFTLITDDCEHALRSIESIVVCTPATEYGAVVRRLAPNLRNGQNVYLVNAPLAGGLQFANCVESIDPELQLTILELGSMFDDAQIVQSAEGAQSLLITGTREKVSVCGNSRNETRRGLDNASTLSEELVPTSNLVERGLCDIERILRPTLLLFALLGARGRDLDCISDIINPSLTTMITALEGEIQALSKAFKCVSHSFLETLTDFAGTCFEDADCLDQALIVFGRNLFAQKTLTVAAATSMLKQDVTESLVLLSELARLSRIPTPVVNSVIDLAAATTRTDLRKQGRSLTDVGLLGFDVTEIVELVNA